MPRLSNDRQENYCKQRAKGMKPAQAALIVGYATGSGTQSNLESDPAIEARILELMEEAETERMARREAAITSAQAVGAVVGASKAWVLQQLAQNATLASNDGEYKASNEALKMIGEELGMFQGASKGQGDDAAPKTMDLHQLTNVLDQAESDRPAALVDEERVKMFAPPSEEQVLDMLGGAIGGKPNLAEARRLNTGSETDVALYEDFDMPPGAPE